MTLSAEQGLDLQCRRLSGLRSVQGRSYGGEGAGEEEGADRGDDPYNGQLQAW